jgi:adenylate cyclase
MTDSPEAPAMSLPDLELCFEGVIPAVVATVAADGTPNVTYLSRVRMVDDERIALSNQFFSKTSRNLAENPRASVMLVDPVSYRQYRLALAYERTERRGRVFELLHEDVAAVAALQGMQDVFKLRAADIYRVLSIEVVPGASFEEPEPGRRTDAAARDTAVPLAELSSRLGRCPDLDTLVAATVDGLAELFGYPHSMLLLLDEKGTGLYTIASRGYDAEGVGSEVPVGEGIIGVAAARCTPVRLGNLGQMAKYARRVRRSFEEKGEVGPGRQVPLPGLAGAQSRVAVPALALGQLVGVLTVDSKQEVAFGPEDEALLTVVATMAGNAIELERVRDQAADVRPGGGAPYPTAGRGSGRSTRVRYFAVDGSTFLDGDYLIKGVAGRLLWSLLQQYDDEGRVEFTHREVRLDPSLELPGFRDNFENRLVLLKRRLDERDAPIRIEKTGRGRFRLAINTELVLESAGSSG